MNEKKAHSLHTKIESVSKKQLKIQREKKRERLKKSTVNNMFRSATARNSISVAAAAVAVAILLFNFIYYRAWFTCRIHIC